MDSDLHRWLADGLSVERQYILELHQELLIRLNQHLQGGELCEVSQIKFGPKVLPPSQLLIPNDHRGEFEGSLPFPPQVQSGSLHPSVDIENDEICLALPPPPVSTAKTNTTSISGRNPADRALTAQFETRRSIGPNDGSGLSHRFKVFVNGFYFEMFFFVAIVVNALQMFAQIQYAGMKTGYQLDRELESRDLSVVGMDDMFEILNIGFGILFSLELTAKLLVRRKAFVKSPWLCIDSVLVTAWFVDLVGHRVALPINPMIFRLIRMVRLVRLVRLARAFKMFDSLNLMLLAMNASLSVFIWSLVILVTVQICVGLTLCGAMEGYINDEANPMERRIQIYRYFGTSTRGMITMFEVTLGNWVPVCRMLMDYVSEWYSFFMLMYKCTMGYAVLNVINAVFLSETMKVAQQDDYIMVVTRERQAQKHLKKMRALFREADESGDGYLSRDEVRSVLQDYRIRLWLSAMDLDVHDTDILFSLLDSVKQDEGESKISAEELTAGVAKLKGTARSLQMFHLLNEVELLRKEVQQAMDLPTRKT